jgi:hypothetical protein
MKPQPSAFTAVTATGSLIAPAQLAQIAAGEARGQDGPSYGVPKGLTLRDELARFFRIGQAQWREFRSAPAPGQAATTRFVETLLRDVLGFADVNRQASALVVEDRRFPVALMSGAVPIVVAPPADALDRPSDSLAAGGRRRSATGVAQDYLNADDASLWGLASNGRCIRLVRDNPSLTRPAFIEFDLAAIFDDEAYADFTGMFLLLHRTRFGDNDADCLLERWREEGAKAGAVARDKLRIGVEAALRLLGQGFVEHPANQALAIRLTSGDLPLPDFFGLLLHLVYRLIFLLSAEDRDLLHPSTASPAARKLYANGYSVSRLRDRAVRRAAWDRHGDAWEGLRITMAALGRSEPRLGLPALGGLFAAGSLGELEGANLANARLLEAIYRLAWLRGESGPVPVNWRDMESEELGSVYEGLLELVPRLERGGAVFDFAGETAETRGNARKTSGSYYTPDSLVQTLLDQALSPLLDQTVAGAEDPAAALLALRVVDPACGSGHFLLAAARRIAARLADVRAGGGASTADYRHALREVMAACIHGVDRNPMAVELAKVALWIESLEPGKPLGLLDANIRCGDALLGLDDLSVLDAGIPDAAYAPLTGDDKAVARRFRVMNQAERDRPILAAIAYNPAKLAAEAARAKALPEDTLEQVEFKRRALGDAAWSPESLRLRQAADAWVTAFLAPKRDGELVPTTRYVWEATHGQDWIGPVAEAVERLAGAARVFHWPLEFPHILAGSQRGFDLVIGNPPWERIKLQEQEFFAARDPAVAAAPNAAARARMIAALRTSDSPLDRTLHVEFEVAKRTAEAASAFARIGQQGRFPLTGRGDVNTYALFAECFSRLVGRYGRAGVIVPTGIATDASTAGFFAAIVKESRLYSLHDFQTGLGFFDRIGHARFKFCLLTIVAIGTGPDRPRFSFFSRTISEYADPRRHFTLSAADIAHINPNTLTAPVFRTELDADLTAIIYGQAPILVRHGSDGSGNPWGVKLRTMFHKTNASHAGDLLSADGIYSESTFTACTEGDYGYQFDHRYSTYEQGSIRYVSDVEHRSPDFEPTFELVAKVSTFLQISRSWTSTESAPSMLGFRRVARSTDDRTSISCILPFMPATYGWILVTGVSAPDQCMLVANFNSLILDYCLRNKLSQPSIPQGSFEQLPILPRERYGAHDRYIIERVLELSYTSNALRGFARSLGYEGPPFKWDEDRRATLRAELDAWYARAYGLTRDQLRYVLDPADVMGADFPSETFRVLKEKEERLYGGDYRTGRLTLAAWDAQERGEL